MKLDQLRLNLKQLILVNKISIMKKALCVCIRPFFMFDILEYEVVKI